MKNAQKAAALAGILALGAPAFANHGGGQPYSVDEKVEKLSRELDLTETQRTAVRDVLESQKARKDAATADVDREAIHRETHERIRALLTDAQKTKYDNMKNDEPDASKPGAAPSPGGY